MPSETARHLFPPVRKEPCPENRTQKKKKPFPLPGGLPFLLHSLFRGGGARLRTRLLRFSYMFALTKGDRRSIRILLLCIAATTALRAWGVVRPAKEWKFSAETGRILTELLPQDGAKQTTWTSNRTSPGSSGPKYPADTNPAYRTTYKPPSYMIKKEFKLELNQADTLDFQQLRGIGPAYARRIVAYRERLGGFVRLDQLREVWGIDSLLFQRILPSVYLRQQKPRPLKINQADLYTLRTHPYLDYYQAKEIYLHRLKHGNFSQLQQIRRVNLMDSGTFARLEPYLSLESAPGNKGGPPDSTKGVPDNREASSKTTGGTPKRLQ